MKTEYNYIVYKGGDKPFKAFKMPVKENITCLGKPICCYRGETCRFMLNDESYNRKLKQVITEAVDRD